MGCLAFVAPARLQTGRGPASYCSWGIDRRRRLGRGRVHNLVIASVLDGAPVAANYGRRLIYRGLHRSRGKLRRGLDDDRLAKIGVAVVAGVGAAWSPVRGRRQAHDRARLWLRGCWFLHCATDVPAARTLVVLLLAQRWRLNSSES